MAYTPPVAPIEADFTVTPYTAPVAPIEADFGSTSVNLIALQGSVVVAGQVPSVTHGFTITPLQGSVVTLGQQPGVTHGHDITVGQGTITTAGQIPRNTVTPIQGSVAVSGLPPGVTHGHNLVPLQGSIVTSGDRPGSVLITVNQGTIIVSGDVPTDVIPIVIIPGVSGYKVFCTITGAADSLLDINIPMSSMTRRWTSDLRSVITAVIPSGVDFADSITSRSNGGLIISTLTFFTDGTESTFNETEHPIESIRSDEGPFSYSISITSGITLPATSRKRVALTGESFRSIQANGLTRVRTVLEDQLLVGDTALLEDDVEILVDNITAVLNGSNRYMEVVGA